MRKEPKRRHPEPAVAGEESLLDFCSNQPGVFALLRMTTKALFLRTD
jgi:hypothetical protein